MFHNNPQKRYREINLLASQDQMKSKQKIITTLKGKKNSNEMIKIITIGRRRHSGSQPWRTPYVLGYPLNRNDISFSPKNNCELIIRTPRPVSAYP